MKNTYLEIIVTIGLLMIMNAGFVATENKPVSDIDKEKALYSEIIKKNIIQALDLPNDLSNKQNKRSVGLPSFLLRGQSLNDESSSYDEDIHTRHRRTERLISRIVLPAIGGDVQSSSFRFRIPRYMPAKKIKSASLWIFNKGLQGKQQDRKKRYLIISTTNNHFKTHETRSILPRHSLWIHFDVTPLVSYVLLSRQKNVDFHATIWCFTNTPRTWYKRNANNLPLTGSFRPRLDIRSRKKFVRSSVPARRPDMCPANVKRVMCCREELYINLTQIAPVIEPKVYRADFCRGHCPDARRITEKLWSHPYRVTLNLYAIKNHRKDIPLGTCISTRKRGINVTYFTKRGELIRIYLRKMIVDGCNCKV